jgi:glycosyltransferase involved in cell wall biosynthesis
VYNERTTVEEIIRRVLAVPMRIQLIVVDDGSKDGSARSSIACRRARFTLLRQANAGKGAALRRGFAAVTGDSSSSRTPTSSTRPRSTRTDRADLQGHADVVFGSRFLGRHRVFMFTHYLGNRS